MDKNKLEAKLADRKESLEKLRSQNKPSEDVATGPYANVELDEEIEQLELEINSLENKLKAL
ncbi:MAG: hypothetical protein JJU01_09770 [Alkalibacterium sp.]|nr:hypothetical protein [Alkalibacterium sp.]TVP93528.1 MAG: hypothetical protein EA249_00150 [Alkalibacterium sp.]